MKAKEIPLNELRMDATEFEKTMRQALQVEPIVEQKKSKNASRNKNKRKSA